MIEPSDTQTPASDTSAFAPADWLRWIGALTFIGAGASYLIEGWSDANVIKRQALWALGTLILTALGIVVVRRRDARGGRVFLGLAAATIPAHFTQLGSALYDLHTHKQGEWSSVLVAGAVTLLLLPPLALGMTALIRRRGLLLSSMMFAFCVPLVVPSRDPAIVMAMAGALLALWLLLEATLFQSDPLFDSLEGAAARLMLVSPVLIALIRNGFHGTGALWLASSIGYPAATLLVWPKFSRIQNAAVATLQWGGLAGMCLALIVLDVRALTFGLVFSTILLAASELIYTRPILLAWMGAMAFSTSAVLAFTTHGWATSLAIIPLGTLHALAAYRRRAGWLFSTAMFASLAGALAHLIQLAVFPKHGLWIAGAVLGVVLLTLASLLETHKARVQRVVARLQHHFDAEQA